MKRLAGLLLMISATASAQPALHPSVEPCKVSVVTAPPDVRAEIEGWVAAEPRCVRQLEVRVVPTEGGLYLTAQDPNGHVRDRVVPDPQSVAVLVVSWMADDSLGTAPPTAHEPPAAHASDDEIPTPVEVPDPESPLQTHTRFHADTPQRYLTLGAIGASQNDAGVRVQVDVLGRSRLGLDIRFGLAGGWTRAGGQARAIVGVTKAVGDRFSVTAQVGVGADYIVHDHDGDGTRDMTQPSVMMMDVQQEPEGFTPRAELGVLGRIAIDRSWGILGGPVVSAPLDEGRVEIGAFVGVQHRL